MLMWHHHMLPRVTYFWHFGLPNGTVKISHVAPPGGSHMAVLHNGKWWLTLQRTTYPRATRSNPEIPNECCNPNKLKIYINGRRPDRVASHPATHIIWRIHISWRITIPDGIIICASVMSQIRQEFWG